MQHRKIRKCHRRDQVSSSLSLLPLLLLVMTLAFAPKRVLAQSNENSDDFSLFLGHMLPNQIEGVTEILPVFGGRYAMGTRAGSVEFSVANTHAYGVDFSTVSASLRGEMKWSPDISGLIYGGADFNIYMAEGEITRKTETGVHLGVGGMMLVTDTLWLRSDLKFMGGPGTSMYLLFGLVFRSSGQ